MINSKQWALAACAATLLASPAGAASSVTLYGTADAGPGSIRYSYHKAGQRASISRTGMRSGMLSDNKFGVKGKEDLGSGLHALFQFEAGVNISNGAAKSNFWDRDALVGLGDAQWGTLTLGRQPDVSKDFVGMNVTGEGLGKIERAFGGKGTRRSGLFKYVTPRLAGAQLGLAYARREDGLRNFYNVGLRYAHGPFTAVATYGQAQLEGKGYDVKDWLIGGTWDFRVAKVLAAYGQDHNGKFKTAGDVKTSDFGAGQALMTARGLGAYESKGSRMNNYFLALQAPLGPGKLGVSYTHSIANMGHLGFDGASQNIVAAIYAYNLSKRSALYGYGAWGNGMGYVDGLKAREFGVGLRHKF